MSIWNAGLVLYNMVMAGIDCSRASVKSYGYNISVIVDIPSSSVMLNGIIANDLTHDHGDIDRLAPFFPESLHVHEGFDGRIGEVNW